MALQVAQVEQQLMARLHEMAEGAGVRLEPGWGVEVRAPAPGIGCAAACPGAACAGRHCACQPAQAGRVFTCRAAAAGEAALNWDARRQRGRVLHLAQRRHLQVREDLLGSATYRALLLQCICGAPWCSIPLAQVSPDLMGWPVAQT